MMNKALLEFKNDALQDEYVAKFVSDNKLTEDEFETLHEFLEIKRKQDPDWGKFGLFE